MSTYGQYCPVAQSLDIIGDRWTLLIIRDMLTGTHHFSDLERGLPGISRALLSKRLQQLQDHGIVEKRYNDSGRKTTEYHLTDAGIDLHNVIHALLMWGVQWSFGDPTLEQMDPLLLMWWMHQRVNSDELPDERTVIQFDFYGAKSDTYWLVLTQKQVDLCVTDPGYDINVLVTADLKTFFKLWLGRVDYHETLETGMIQVDGVPQLAREFPNWFEWSPAAPAVIAHRMRT